MLRLHVDAALAPGRLLLPEAAARHAQVLRLQPGDALLLFDGRGGEWAAEVESMGRREVAVQVREHRAVEREAALAVTLAVAVPANERFEWLIEKATELGVAAVQPLQSERSVVRLAGERAERRAAHWQAVAVAAAEQSGRTRVPPVAPLLKLTDWLSVQRNHAHSLWLLDPAAGVSFAAARAAGAADGTALAVLSGPEGGFSPAECEAARAAGACAVNLGPRILRADTAPLAVLAALLLEHAA